MIILRLQRLSINVDTVLRNIMISVITQSFNHERFVGFFIESVLAQTFEDFELIIVDDCSNDNNINEILKYKDSRIKLIQHEYNKGINATLNTAFENSSGDLLVFCAMMKNDVVGVYVALELIDKNNQPVGRSIESREYSKYGHLRSIFLHENSLTSPGLCLRRETFAYMYPLPSAVCNLQDMYMHVKILLQGEIMVLPDRLVQYRIEHGQNISAKSAITFMRENLEIQYILDAFLEITDVDLLSKVFSIEIAKINITPYLDTIQFFLGRMALESPDQYRRIWGYHKIMEVYNDKIYQDTVLQKYNFAFKDFLNFSKICIDDSVQRKYKKYKKFFNITIIAFVSVVLIFAITIIGIKGII